MGRRWLPILIAAIVALVPISAARADGDPGSDVLVYQSLFLAADSGISVGEQVQLGRLIAAADRAGMPIRVAIIAKPADLGSVTPLWDKPQTYARYLGIELSLAYSGRLLVVMPDGFGFNWPKHDLSAAYATLAHVPRGTGPKLATSAAAAIRALAAAAHVQLGSGSAATSTTQTEANAPSIAPQAAGDGSQTTGGGSRTLAFVVLLLVVLAAFGAPLVRRQRRAATTAALRRVRAVLVARRLAVAGIAAFLAIAVAGYAAFPRAAHRLAGWSNPLLDPGTALARPAPSIDLTNQFGQPVSLAAMRGKVVVLAFIDSECTTMCPLTSQAMVDAKAMLGSAGRNVQLVGVDANPRATALQDVAAYSQVHGMLHAWDFLTGSLPALRRVWHAYSIEATISRKSVDHTPAIFLINPEGRLVREYIVQQSYAAIGQLGQLIAGRTASLLPSHPKVDPKLSYKLIPGIYPTSTATLPQTGGGNLSLGPGAPHLLLFFATWDRQITDLGGGLDGLNTYEAGAARAGLPKLTAIDEGAVEPRGALAPFLHGLTKPLAYPVAVDATGRLADGYEVEGEPWLMLVGADGSIDWYYSVARLGWPTTAKLVADVKKGLRFAARRARGTTTATTQPTAPPALETLQQQASQMLGSYPALHARIRALRGYPIVINVWASWCVPCRSEFGLFRTASARYGSRIAFLGADADDSAGDAHSFLQQHPVNYPSYSVQTTQLTPLASIEGLPTTIYISRAGKVAYVHTGQYSNQKSLDSDIATYGGG